MGRPKRTTRLTVEDCPVSLSIVWLHRLARLFNRAPGETVWLTLLNPLNREPLAQIECQYSFREPHGLVVLVRAEDAHCAALCDRQMIPVVTTVPNFGGARFWFLCDCGRRVAKLYVPPAMREFRCRSCYDLTYRSAQTHSEVDYLAHHPDKLMEADLSPNPTRRFLAFIAAMRMQRIAERRQQSRMRQPFRQGVM